MSATITIESIKLRDRLNQLASLGLNMGRVIRVETRRLMQEVIRQTHPPNQEQGKARVQSDLRRLFMPVENSILSVAVRGWKKDGKAGTRGTRQTVWLTKNGQIFGTLQENFRPDLTADGMAAIHSANRGNDGRVKSGRGNRITKTAANYNQINRLVVKRSEFNRLLKTKLSNVGKMRAGFAPGALAVGVKLPSWVLRNMTPANGTYTANLGPGTSPSITIRNTTPGVVTHTAAIVTRAMNARQMSIGQNLKRMLKHGTGAAGDYGYAQE